MKIALFIFVALLVFSLVWSISAYRFPQSDGTILNQDLLIISEQLLYKVKTDGPVDSLRTSLKRYTVENLRTGLIDDNARKVFWINLYNAFYQILAIHEKKDKNSIYTDKSIYFSDTALSLDDIEHGILRKYRWKYSLGYLPQFLPSATIKILAVTSIDYRIHFALNCGAKSCPPIAFYQYEKLNSQLDRAAQSFLENETTVEATKQELHVSKIMQWFKGDFGGEKGIKKKLAHYLGGDYSSYTIKFKDYDWSDDLKNFAPSQE